MRGIFYTERHLQLNIILRWLHVNNLNPIVAREIAFEGYSYCNSIYSMILQGEKQVPIINNFGVISQFFNISGRNIISEFTFKP